VWSVWLIFVLCVTTIVQEQVDVPHNAFCSSCIWPSSQALVFVPCGHGFDSYPDGQGYEVVSSLNLLMHGHGPSYHV